MCIRRPSGFFLLGLALFSCAAPAAAPPPPPRPTPAAAQPPPPSGPAAVTVNGLRTERRSDPIGLDVRAPHLAWLLSARDNDQAQTAYQVLVASTRARLDADQGDLWDSGRVDSDASIEIPYAGKPLASRQIAHWKVRVWDAQGRASGFSDPATWEMGLLDPATEFSARYIGRPRTTVNAPAVDTAALRWLWVAQPKDAKLTGDRWAFFRGTIAAPDAKTLARATLTVGADGLFHVFINGQLVHSGLGSGKLRFFDLGATARATLKPGRNLIAIAVRNDNRKSSGMTAQFRFTPRAGGADKVVSADRTWRAIAGEVDGWMAPGFNDRTWAPVAEVATFGAAPFDKVTAEQPRGMDSEPPAYLFRKQCLGEGTSAGAAAVRPVRARLYATALGIYDVFLNGRRVGDQVFAPGWTDYRQRLEYQTYDVTGLLDGPCVTLAAVLADGWYMGSVGFQKQRAVYGEYPLRLAAQLEVLWPDGRLDRLTTDGDWSAGQGPLRIADFLDGERHDARAEIKGWPRPEAVPAGFVPVDVLPSPPPARLVAQAGPPIKVVMDRAPKDVSEPKPGRFVFDLGQNLVGWAKLKVSGPAGARVALRFAEMLNPDGTIYTRNLRAAQATDEYTLRGDPGGEVWEPRFTSHGFRYVEVSGFPGKPTPSSLLVKVVHSETRGTGRLQTSSPLINKLQANIVWGQRGNFVGLPTDCPQRDERLGWMGDAQIFARTACFNMDVSNFFAKWLRDVYDAQDKDGGLADTIPYVDGLGGRPGAPAWTDAGLIVPWTMYQCYGDPRFLAEHYAGMQRHIELILRSNPDLLWRKMVGPNYGDWLSINAKTPKDLLATAYFAHSTGLLARAATLLGRAADAQKYTDLRRRIAARFTETFVKPDGTIEGDTQTAYLLALQFDLLPADRRAQAEAHLVAAITRADFHLTTGFLGVRELLPGLTDLGRVDLAYRLLENETFPSWGYSIKHGATTIWERWDGWTAEKGFQSEGMNSFNHYSLGSVGQWLYANVGGIDLDPAQPAYKRLIIRPRPGGSLTSARASLDTPYGRVQTDWNTKDGKFALDVTIPVNTRATVILPDGVRREVGSGSHAFVANLPPAPAAAVP